MRNVPYIVVFIIVFVVGAFNSFADSCTECHKNPQYTKEDADILRECLACHGSAGHPLKTALRDGERVAPDYSDKKSPGLTTGELKKMTYIPAGEFIMGTFERHKDERPTHVVYVDDFYIDRYEVTNDDYKKFVTLTGHFAPDHWQGPEAAEKGFGTHPVVYVSWYDAYSYCKWSGKRLLREWEWEKAARGTDGRSYPWGNKFDLNKSNNPVRWGAILPGSGEEEDDRGKEQQAGGTMPVGSFKNGVSPYGIFDMSGNVWEWIDEYYISHPGNDTVSPEFSNKYRLMKGGSWWDCMFYNCGISAPTYNRSFFDPITKNNSSGFRCGVGGREVKHLKKGK